MLSEQRCTVGEIGDDRWVKARFYNPRRGERGTSYTFAAGVLDDVWGFDPSVFGLSPREAENMDPQQRILLQVVWEALEDAGIPPSRLAGKNVGVYVGVSSPDTATRRAHDVGAADAYTMTGSTLSLVSNRLSYVFDWHGPSFSVDTACSSSLVALSQALDALRAGVVDTAVVGGLNMLLSPFPFLGFAAARMLAPDGRCRPFDADGQGYVRAEGAVALVLRRRDAAPIGAGRCYAEVVAAGVNSDGRTSGVSLPSSEAQAALLRQVYQGAAIDPVVLAFVEAHGTGTKVGDPAEAGAIGSVLGRARKAPLPIGSIKSNIGHLEPAAGLAGVLKALLAFDHRLLPASLHCRTPNPAIAFKELNIEVARQPLPLDIEPGVTCAGVSAFGFGGTNAHVILRAAAPANASAKAASGVFSSARKGKAGGARAGHSSRGQGLFMLTAQCSEGLIAAARGACELIAADDDAEIGTIAAAFAHGREALPERLAALAGSRDEGLRVLGDVIAGKEAVAAVRGRAAGRQLPVAFVYTGNGSQWAGMGRAAYAANSRFRARLDALSRRYQKIGGWSLVKALEADDLAARLGHARTAQPLLFAIQAALTDTLIEMGLAPSLVIGHSVGEIAAAYACGALDEAAALRVIAARSGSQELVRGAGTMAALALGEEEARALIEASGTDSVEIGAINSPRSVTLSGPQAAIEACAKLAAVRGHRVKVLDLAYPFHSALLDVTRAPLLKDLEGLKPCASRVPFVSTVTGCVLAGEELGAEYWWRNVRSPVRFGEGIAHAASHGARAFVEISPRAILQGYLAESLGEHLAQSALIPSLGNTDVADADPVRLTLARALTRGAAIDVERVFGTERSGVRLPLYPWQNKPYDVAPSPEASALMLGTSDRHRYLGWREREGEPTWFCHLDTNLMPELGDHRIGGQVYVPGAVLAEMAMAAAQSWLGDVAVEVFDLDILAPMVLADDHMREVRTAIEPGSRSLQITSRRRMSDEDWQVHVEARFGPATGESPSALLSYEGTVPVGGFDAESFYALARGLGLDYGPSFRRLEAVGTGADDQFTARIIPSEDTSPPGLLLDPIALDVAFHGLLFKLMGRPGDGRGAQGYVPVRFGRVRVHARGRKVRSASISVTRRGIATARCDVVLLDADGTAVASVEDARFKASSFVRRRTLSEISAHVVSETVPLPGLTPAFPVPNAEDVLAALAAKPAAPTASASEEARLLLEAAARRVALDVTDALAEAGAVDPSALVAVGRLAPGMEASLAGLLRALEAAGLAQGNGRVWRIDTDAPLPPLDAIVQTVIADHPEWWPDCALLAEAAVAWPERLSSGIEHRTPPYSAGVREALSLASPRARDRVTRVLDAVQEAVARITVGAGPRPIRVLELGCGAGALTVPLARMLASHGPARLVAVDAERRAVEKLRTQLAGASHADVIEESQLAAQAAGGFDLVVSANGLHRLASLDKTLAALRQGGGVLLIADCAAPDTFHDVVFGLDPAWLGDTAETKGATSVFQTLDFWRRRLEGAGFELAAAADTHQLADLMIGMIDSGQPGIRPAVAPYAQAHVIGIDASPSRLVTALRSALGGQSRATADTQRDTSNGLVYPVIWAGVIESCGPKCDLVVVCEPGCEGADAADLLRDRLGEFTALAQSIGDRSLRLWIVVPGALRDQTGDGAGNAVNAAVAAFARTLTNEMPKLDVRVVDHAATLEPTAVAVRIAGLVSAPGGETEIVLRETTIAALRAAQGLPAIGNTSRPAKADAVRLDLSRDPGAERLVWHRVPRRPPGRGEVEVAVAATGLNFRDCMWSMGLLPEEALEDGFAGPTLGFECSGRVVRIGEGVTGFAEGQAVIAFAPAAFASHVTVAAGAIAAIPEQMDLVAAATVPVPFITAYYAMEYLARLTEGESILIHGGAGGVGLAALQIAKWRGAVVFATAGSEDKRRLLTLLGADHVLDSRSLDFAGEIMRITQGKGVDVVLNSLAGEAMERSLALVKPFGRFLELGKRDFYGATKIGLRPFRRNVSYFGIDADQLLAQKPELSRRLFSDLSRHLADGTFVPLPYRRFEGTAVAEAFRLMQQSGHIGKIVVTPPVPADVPAPAEVPPFGADPEGAHIVVGGLGGFGLATAKWLVARGARRVVLVSRSGKPAQGGEGELCALHAAGVDVIVAAADAADEAALADVLAQVRAKGPIRGIVHAAMVIDDDFIERLTPERIGHVLKPKVTAAENLDRLTRGDALQYFVLYSSVTVLIGNPGQAAYVAANGYLEALARRRRAEGLPALAVGWGGITDTGYLARNTEVGRAIERRTGTGTFTAGEALDHLGDLIARGAGSPAALTVAPMTWSAAREQLPMLSKPLFEALTKKEARAGSRPSETIDVAAEIAGLDETAAREVVVRYLAEEVARIFRMSVADVGASRSLAELGMDSLMGLELRLAVQQRLGADIPLSAMSGGQTLSDIAARIASTLRAGEAAEPGVGSVNADLVVQHVAQGMDAERLAPLLREIDRRDATVGAE